MVPEIYQILTWSTTCCMYRVEKVSRAEEGKKFRLCREPTQNTRKMINLPSAIKKHSANNVFVECH